MKPLILLTAGYEVSPNGQSRRYLYQSYADAITCSGGIPLLPLDDGGMGNELAERADGLMLTGGPDINPSLYGEDALPECGPIDAQRDAMEYKLLDHFIKSSKPIFGICRGMQIINSYFGGTLWQDLPSQLGVMHDGGDKPHDCVHKTVLLQGSLLHGIYGDFITTNSYHHQAVNDMAQGFISTAICDGVIEAMTHTSLPISTVQWHPERMTGRGRFMHHGPDSEPLFSAFVRQCVAVSSRQTL